MTPHQLYVDKIEALHPMLQISLCDWIEKELPRLALQLDTFVIPINGNYLTLDAVTKRMAEAALAVLLASVEATGCHKP